MSTDSSSTSDSKQNSTFHLTQREGDNLFKMAVELIMGRQVSGQELDSILCNKSEVRRLIARVRSGDLGDEVGAEMREFLVRLLTGKVGQRVVHPSLMNAIQQCKMIPGIEAVADPAKVEFLVSQYILPIREYYAGNSHT